jgi:hypothetical protein
MSSAYNKFDTFVDDVSKQVHNLSTAVLKVMLTNVLPVRTNHIKTDITEIAAGNGYVAGGGAATPTLSNASGTEKLVCANAVITAAGGAVGPFRYAVLYNSTAASGNLIGWWDYGSSQTLSDGENFTVEFDGTNGVLQIT